MSYCDQLCNKKGSLTVFVPLCGKTKDMRWYGMIKVLNNVRYYYLTDVAISQFLYDKL